MMHLIGRIERHLREGRIVEATLLFHNLPSEIKVVVKDSFEIAATKLCVGTAVERKIEERPRRRALALKEWDNLFKM